MTSLRSGVKLGLMKKEFRKANFGHSNGNYEFMFDCGDLYTRENISFDEDLKYCKSIIEIKNPKDIQSIKAHIKYTIPDKEDINEMKRKKINTYDIQDKRHLYTVELFEFNQKDKNFRICEEIWFGYEDFIKNLIKQLKNLKKIYFFGRIFQDINGDTPYDIEDDEIIRNELNNPSWEDSTFLEPSEDPDDLEQLKILKKMVGKDIQIKFEALNDACEKIVIKEGIGENFK